MKAPNRMRRLPRATQRGFTLLELLVAVGLLAIVAVMSWRGLDEILRTHDSLATAEGRLDELQRVFQRLEQDALLARDARAVDNRLQLSNGAAVVQYSFDGASLTRQVPGVEQGAVRFQGELAGMDAQVWQEHLGWTNGMGVAAPGGPRAPTTGVRIRLTLRNGSVASRVFLLGSGI